jgi:hypothetical protein
MSLAATSPRTMTTATPRLNLPDHVHAFDALQTGSNARAVRNVEGAHNAVTTASTRHSVLHEIGRLLLAQMIQ